MEEETEVVEGETEVVVGEIEVVVAFEGVEDEEGDVEGEAAVGIIPSACSGKRIDTILPD